MRAATALAVLLAAAPAAARRPVEGDGRKTTERRALAGFDAVALRGVLDAVVKVGPAHGVAVTVDENVQAHVLARVEGSTLVVDTDRDVDWKGVGVVEITLPALRSLSVSGSGDVTVEGAKGGDLVVTSNGSGDVRWTGEAATLEVSTNGSGDVELAGRADRLVARTSGSGDVGASGLAVRDAEVKTSGSGDVALRLAGGALRAWSSGSGDVTWSGDAATVEHHAFGSGDVRRE